LYGSNNQTNDVKALKEENYNGEQASTTFEHHYFQTSPTFTDYREHHWTACLSKKLNSKQMC